MDLQQMGKSLMRCGHECGGLGREGISEAYYSGHHFVPNFQPETPGLLRSHGLPTICIEPIPQKKLSQSKG